MKIDIGKRKHISQMNSNETSTIWKRLKNVQEFEWKLVGHALKRLAEKKIKANRYDIISTIYNSEIIEYRIVHNNVTNSHDERVILRSKAIVNEKFNLNAVFSLTNKRIVTVWINHINDRHDTLDWSIYDKNMKVLGA